MKKAVSLICILFIITNLIFFIPNTSYGICNTFRFSKEVSAVQLILANGNILYNLKVDKDIKAQQKVSSNSYKNLNLVFMIETEDEIYQNKSTITSFINKIYELYGDSANKLSIAIIPFSENGSNNYSYYQTENLYKSNKEEVLNEINNPQNNNLSLEGALRIAARGNSLKENKGGVKNEELLQQIVIITDGIKNEEELWSSNAILRILDENMISMYSIIVGDWYQSEECSILTSNLNGMMLSNISNASDIGNQLNNDVYEYVSNYVVDTSNFMPTGGGKGNMLMPDRIVLTVDSEIAQGATLKIEYNMPIRANAVYGTGKITDLTITDKKDPNLSFSKDEKLITDPSKTNADYGWDMNDKGEVVTTKKMVEANLVLSVLLSSNQLEEAVYTNSANCRIKFENGKDDDGKTKYASYSRSSTAMEVQVLPPFGEDKQNKFIIVGIIVASIILIITVVFIRKKD